MRHQVNTSVGDVLIKANGRNYYMRPSFLSVSNIGSPKEIVRIFKLLCRAYEVVVLRVPDNALSLYPLSAFSAIDKVINACLYDEDSSDITGYVKRGKHVQRLATYHDLVVIAYHLLKHGIAGKPKKKVEGGEELKEFDATEYVGLSVAHLGISNNDAWNMTMVEFQRAFDAKFPSKEDENIKDQQKVNQSDYDNLMAEHERIMAKREAKLAKLGDAANG